MPRHAASCEGSYRGPRFGIGVRPDVDFLRGSGIVMDDGVMVDRHLQASVAYVYAAGDVASFFDPVFNLRWRIEHWDNAVKQGKLDARHALRRASILQAAMVAVEHDPARSA